MTEHVLSAPVHVQRWTAVSATFTAALAGLLVALAFAPAVLGENSLNNLKIGRAHV